MAGETFLLALFPILGIGLPVVRRGYSPLEAVSFVERSLASGAGLVVVLLAVAGYLLSFERAETGTLVTGAAWPACALLATGTVFLWSAVSAFLYVRYGIELSLRGKITETIERRRRRGQGTSKSDVPMNLGSTSLGEAPSVRDRTDPATGVEGPINAIGRSGAFCQLGDPRINGTNDVPGF